MDFLQLTVSVQEGNLSFERFGERRKPCIAILVDRGLSSWDPWALPGVLVACEGYLLQMDEGSDIGYGERDQYRLDIWAYHLTRSNKEECSHLDPLVPF